jgi:sterol desaturase/sphingolipid hydroxylase (fatty acid hydroxylase superfamily)
MPDLDTAAWYAFAIPAYVVYVVLEIVIARRRAARVFSFAETISNLTCGLGTLVIGLFVGPFVLRAWDLVHDHVAPFRWPLHGVWKVPAALVLADFCYYVYHRAGHRFAIFWSIHGIHHQHEHLNSSVGFRLEWLADPYAALFFGLMPLCGVDSQTGFFAIALLSFYTLTAHSAVLPRPTFGFLITPAIHGSHHSRDARFFGKNYGAMLGIWDRLFGTWLEPRKDDTLRADVPSICRTHDGVTAQLGLVAELARALHAKRTLREKISLLLAPPELAGPGATLRDDADIERPVRAYVLAQFLAIASLGGWLLWVRESRPLAIQIAAAAVVVVGLRSIGGILDDRPRAMSAERTRLVATAIAGVLFVGYSPIVSVAMVSASLASLAVTTKLKSPRSVTASVSASADPS